MNTDPITLHAAFADYPHLTPIRQGQVTSGLLRFEFAEIKPIAKAFKPMVRDLAFDVSELALFTYLQARAYGKPVVMLPATMFGRFQHHCMLYNSDRGTLAPSDLPGRRIGVRAYSQSTAAWLRGILQNDFGVDTRGIKWVTFEDAHVAEYADPPGVERAASGKDITAMLLAGEIDAAIYGAAMPQDARLRSIIPNPDDAALAWYRAHGVVPVNHVVAVTENLARSRPDAVTDIYRMLREGKAIAGAPKPIDTIPFGFDAMRPALELSLKYAEQQQLLPRAFTVEEIIDATRKLVALD